MQHEVDVAHGASPGSRHSDEASWRQIHKRLQKGVVNGLFYLVAPTSIFHTWVEVLLDGRWLGLEGVILDKAYLHGLRTMVPTGTTALLGFGAGTGDLTAPPVEWRGAETSIQSTGVNGDFGIYADPDAFYAEHGDNLTGPRAWLYAKWIRHVLNANVAKIREGAGNATKVADEARERNVTPHASPSVNSPCSRPSD